MKRIVALTSFIFILAGCGSDYKKPEEVVTPPPPVQVFTPSQTYEITLNGTQQVPRNNTDTSATAIIEVDESLNLFTIDIDTTNLSNIDAAHIHVGGIGVNGDVLFALEPDGESSYVLDETSIDDDTIAQLAAGNFYLNIHTDAYPNGEVRGQIVTADTTILLFGLSGQQEVPAVQTTASGDGYATHDAATGNIDVVLRTTGVPDATAAHIHVGRVGMNGDVLTAFEQSMDDENVWML
ncbi:CHRD domain-containing protein, partial [Alteromonas sp. MTD1]|uniref:CHRD domain-containing protein n=1 Tax=Alteromonas sp. MTD1 TaxID=3057962 RepID=UPI0036F2453D